MNSDTKRKLKWKIRNFSRKILPYVNHASTIAEAAILLRDRSFLSMTGLGILILKTGVYLYSDHPESIQSHERILSGDLVSIAEKVCADLCIRSEHKKEGGEYFFRMGRISFSKSEREVISFYADHPGDIDLLSSKIYSGMKSHLPKHLFFDKIDPEIGRGSYVISSKGYKSKYSPKANHILENTVPMLVDGKPRSILLTGNPGAGKTVAANWIADQLVKEDEIILHFSPSVEFLISDRNIKRFCNMGVRVIVIDDIDKFDDLKFTLSVFANLPENLNLVIMTANNGYDDKVLDGSFVRCGRIGESWEIRDIGINKEIEPPFDQLELDIWEKIKTLSTASIEEVRMRILNRGAENLRLEDILIRENMRCFSENKMHKEREVSNPKIHPDPDEPPYPIGLMEKIFHE